MKRFLKRTISVVLCLVMLTGILSISAFALNAEDYKDLPYKNYTYLGDSVSWGYGLADESGDDRAKLVYERVEGSFTDIIGDVLEAANGAKVNCAACSGVRMSDFRAMLELGMGLEDPYPGVNDWFGNRHPDRTETFMSKGALTCDYIRQSDLITLEVGLNDLTSVLLNTLSACGFIDIGKLTSISDVDSAMEYLAFALDSIGEVDILNSMLKELTHSIGAFREDSRMVLKHVVDLAPDDADIIFVGYYDATANLRIIPNSSTSLVCSFISAAIRTLNDFFADLASEYDNVYFVEIDDVSTFFGKDADVLDLLNGEVDFLKGIHPDAAGQEALAKGVLGALKEINTCHHIHTSTVSEKVKIARGYEYVTSTVCTDCGKVLDMGKVITPIGTIKVPVNTVNYFVSSAEKLISTAAKALGGLFGAFRR